MSRAKGGEPRLWRKQRNGKAYGCWLVTVDGADVNLNTKSAEIARGRLADALRGKRGGWPTDAELAARAMEGLPPVGAPAAADTGPQTTAGVPSGPAPVVPEVFPPAGAAAGELPKALPPVPPAAQPAQPQAAPAAPSEQEARAEAEATNAAAAETAENKASDAGAAGDTAAFNLGPDAIRGLLGQAGKALVEVQLQLQAWLVFRRTGKIAPSIDPDSPVRDIAAQAWAAQFERWFPDMTDVAPWVLAVALPAMALPAQFMGAQPPPPQNPEESGPSAAAGDPAAHPAQAAA